MPLGRVSTWIACALMAACSRESEDAPVRMTAVTPDAAALPQPDAAAGVASAVSAIRERSLDIPPRDAPAQRIAFGTGRLAQLADKELIVRATADYSVVLRAPVQEPRAITELADGSLLIAAGDGLYQLEPRAKALVRYPRVIFLPGSLLLSDRKDPKRFFTFHTASGSLYPYLLEKSDAPLLPFGEASELGAVSRGAFTPLKDGSFLYASAGAMSRVFPHGKKQTFELPPRSGEIKRLLTTRRIDQAWSVWSDRKLELFQVAPQLRSVRTLALPPNVFDVASSDRFVAALCWQTQPSGPRRWSLSVIDDDGVERFSVEVPGQPAPGAGEDWIRAVTLDKTLIMSRREPLIAVGGPTRFSVWNIEKKSLVSGTDTGEGAAK